MQIPRRSRVVKYSDLRSGAHVHFNKSHTRNLHYYCRSMSCLFVDRPTKVQLGIYVNSFYSISEQTMVRKQSLVWFDSFYVRVSTITAI